MTDRKALAAILALLGLLLVACQKQTNWHQKITVILDTPNGVRTGSFVSMASVEDLRGWNLGFPEAGQYSYRLQGEAVVIQIEPGLYLFALLGEPDAFQVFHWNPLNAGATVDGIAKPLSKDLEPEQYPRFVTFTDINDPTTVKEVPPDKMYKVMGSGVNLRAVTLSIVNEPVSEPKIASLLPWLVDQPGLSPSAMHENAIARADTPTELFVQ